MSNAVVGISGAGQATNLQDSINAEDFKNALKNNINLGATQDQIVDFMLSVPDRFGDVPAATRNMLLSVAMEELQQTVSLLTSMLRSCLQTARTVISNLRL